MANTATPKDCRAFLTELPELYIEPTTVGWESLKGRQELVSKVPVSGPQNASYEILMTYPRDRAGLVIKIQLLRNGAPVARLDLVGPSHVDLRTGQSVPTPHFQMATEHGAMDAVAVDCGAEGVEKSEDALRWFCQRLKLQSTPSWNDPPLQPRLGPAGDQR